MQTLKLENRAWHGTRLEPLNKIDIEKNKRISFSIERHHVLNNFMLEKHTYLNRHFKVIRDKDITEGMHEHCYGKAVFFGDTIQDCINFIKNEYNINIELMNEPIKKAYWGIKKMFKTEICCEGCNGIISFITEKQYKFMTLYGHCKLHENKNRFFVIKSEPL